MQLDSERGTGDATPSKMAPSSVVAGLAVLRERGLDQSRIRAGSRLVQGRIEEMTMARVHVVSVSFVVGLVFGLMADTPSALQDSSPKRHIKSADLREGAPYSSAVHVGDTLYLSGRTGADRRTRQVPESLAREVRNILDGMQRTLADAGMTMDDLVSVQVYCPDVSLYDQFNDVYVTYFEGELPARAFLGSGPLLNGANFEIQGIAVKGS